MKSLFQFATALGLFALVGCGEATTSATDSSTDSGVNNATSTAVEAELTVPDEAPAQPEDAINKVDVDNAADEAVVKIAPGSLNLGDQAPPMAIASFAHGEPVQGFEDGKIYVVEFWATWCPPCKASMPHLSKLSDKYEGKVTFVGFSAEKPDVVEGFLKQQKGDSTWADVVTYTLAMDKNRLTSNNYMGGTNQGGIPTAYIVGRSGALEWYGHPMEMDEPLEKIVAGEWDLEKAIADQNAQKEVEAAMDAANAEIRGAVNNQDWDKAISVVDKLIAKFPEQDQLQLVKLNFLQQSGDSQKFAAAAAKMFDSVKDNSQALNGIAWTIAAEMTGDDRDLALAEKAALQASKLTDDKDGAILDTVARVYFELGQVDKAIAWQKKAVAAMPENADLEQSLKDYEEAKKKAAAPAEETKDKAAETKAEESASEEKAESKDAKPAEKTEAAADESK